ncbi:MAG TPA: hypothetical protein VGO93_05040 [Candidatus Xenobia bacterium]|jgi:hypothetical protein
MSDAQEKSDQRLKVAIVVVWAVVMAILVVVVFRKSRPQSVPLESFKQLHVEHPSVDGVEVGMPADAAPVKALVASRQTRTEAKSPPKDALVEFKDGTSIYYNTYGEVGGIEGRILKNGQVVVAQIGEPLTQVEQELGKPLKDMSRGSPRSVVYLLSPGICTQLFLADNNTVSRLNLYQVNPKPRTP